MPTIHTIASAIQWGTERLKHATDSAILDCEILLAHTLNCSRSHLFAWPDKQIPPDAWLSFATHIDRRTTRFPVSYITGNREFWSRDFVVTPDVLIPRPDTELLVEVALEILEQQNLPMQVADLGTGSGAIAITLALENRNCEVVAIDRSLPALAIAKTNAAKHQARINLLCSSWMDSLASQSLDMIVSNPPYIASNDPHLNNSEISHEPVSALTSGPDGLDDIRLISAQAQQKLKPSGVLIFEHGFEQHAKVSNIMKNHGFTKIETYKDFQGHPRVTLGQQSPQPPT